MYFGVSGKATRGWYYITMLASFPNVPKTYSVRNRRYWLLHCRLTPPLHGAPGNIRINLILPESRVTGLHRRWLYRSIFIQFFLVGSERRTCFETQCVMALQGHPGSLILAPIESSYAISCWSSIVTLVLSCPVSQILQVFCGELTQLYSNWILGVFVLD